MNYCRQTDEICTRCGKSGHLRANCTNEVRCQHCAAAHYSNDKSCPKYICEQTTLTLSMKEKIPRIEALDIVLSRNPAYIPLYDRESGETNIRTQTENTSAIHTQEDSAVATNLPSTNEQTQPIHETRGSESSTHPTSSETILETVEPETTSAKNPVTKRKSKIQPSFSAVMSKSEEINCTSIPSSRTFLASAGLRERKQSFTRKSTTNLVDYSCDGSNDEMESERVQDDGNRKRKPSSPISNSDKHSKFSYSPKQDSIYKPSNTVGASASIPQQKTSQLNNDRNNDSNLQTIPVIGARTSKVSKNSKNNPPPNQRGNISSRLQPK